MGWITDTTSPAWIVDENDSHVERLVGYGAGHVVAAWKRTVTTLRKHVGSLTKTAAETIQTNELKATPAASVKVERQNDAGAYRVVYTLQTVGAWAKET